MTINLGAILITVVGLIVGLSGLLLAWKLVRALPSDHDAESAEAGSQAREESAQVHVDQDASPIEDNAEAGSRQDAPNDGGADRGPSDQ